MVDSCSANVLTTRWFVWQQLECGTEGQTALVNYAREVQRLVTDITEEIAALLQRLKVAQAPPPKSPGGGDGGGPSEPKGGHSNQPRHLTPQRPTPEGNGGGGNGGQSCCQTSGCMRQTWLGLQEWVPALAVLGILCGSIVGTLFANGLDLRSPVFSLLGAVVGAYYIGALGAIVGGYIEKWRRDNIETLRQYDGEPPTQLELVNVDTPCSPAEAAEKHDKETEREDMLAYRDGKMNNFLAVTGVTLMLFMIFVINSDLRIKSWGAHHEATSSGSNSNSTAVLDVTVTPPAEAVTFNPAGFAVLVVFGLVLVIQTLCSLMFRLSSLVNWLTSPQDRVNPWVSMLPGLVVDAQAAAERQLRMEWFARKEKSRLREAPPATAPNAC